MRHLRTGIVRDRRALLWIASAAGIIGALQLSASQARAATPPARPSVSEAALKEAMPKEAMRPPDAPSKAASSKVEASADTSMTLRGGQERTDFRTLTVEGEDRVHLEIERPQLTLDLDPEKVGGLESGTASDILNRVPPDLLSTYLACSAFGISPYVAHPWLRQFSTGPVARFQPNVKGVERWNLVVADSKGQTVTTFEGKGDPPREIAWDGRSAAGTFVSPGITYSYIFEAFDRAGNKRNFVGDGFSVSAYRLDSPEGPLLVFSGQSLLASAKAGRGSGVPASGAPKGVSPLLIEAAGWLNQTSNSSQPMRVTTTARSLEQAQHLASRVTAALSDLAMGDPSRIQTVTQVAADAPDGGTVQVGPFLNSPPDRSNSRAR
jgi:hypothetical protein